jgi:hypothetical protein
MLPTPLLWLGLVVLVCAVAVPVIAAIILSGRINDREREWWRNQHG